MRLIACQARQRAHTLTRVSSNNSPEPMPRRGPQTIKTRHIQRRRTASAADQRVPRIEANVHQLLLADHRRPPARQHKVAERQDRHGQNQPRGQQARTRLKGLVALRAPRPLNRVSAPHPTPRSTDRIRWPSTYIFQWTRAQRDNRPARGRRQAGSALTRRTAGRAGPIHAASTEQVSAPVTTSVSQIAKLATRHGVDQSDGMAVEPSALLSVRRVYAQAPVAG
jgi:hypothetical protein